MNATNGTLVWSEVIMNRSRFWAQRVILPVVVIIGVCGNALTIIVLTRRGMRSSTNTYLTALAVSDMCILLGHFYLSLAVYQSMHQVDYLWYWHVWRFILWLADAASGTSVLLTVSFTLERYMAVCHPLRRSELCTESRARRVSLAVVLACLLLTATTPYEYYIQAKWDPVTNRTTLAQLTPLAHNTLYTTIFYWLWSSIFVIIPLIILFILNTLLIIAVQSSTQQRNDLTQARRGGVSYRQRQENKITNTLIAVVFLFLVCQTPTAVTLIVKIFYNPPSNSLGDHILRSLGNIFNLLVSVNAASNFILYCAMSDKYRRTALITFCPSWARTHIRANTFPTSTRMTSIRRNT